MRSSPILEVMVISTSTGTTIGSEAASSFLAPSRVMRYEWVQSGASDLTSHVSLRIVEDTVDILSRGECEGVTCENMRYGTCDGTCMGLAIRFVWDVYWTCYRTCMGLVPFALLPVGYTHTANRLIGLTKVPAAAELKQVPGGRGRGRGEGGGEGRGRG